MNERMADLTRLARCRLVFIEGVPPQSEDGTLLIYRGGCNAVAGYWHNGKLIDKATRRPMTLEDVDSWMRMPHPSIWPTVSKPPPAIPETDLYSQIFHAFLGTAMADKRDLTATRLLMIELRKEIVALREEAARWKAHAQNERQSADRYCSEAASTADELAFWRYQAIYYAAHAQHGRAPTEAEVSAMVPVLDAARVQENRERHAHAEAPRDIGS